MIDIFSRHRPLALLASVVLAQVLLLAFQIKREHDVRLIRYWAVALITPLERGGTWSFSKVGGVWSGYIGLHNARAENEQLRTNWTSCACATASSKARPPKRSASALC